MRFIHDPLVAERSVSIIAGFLTMTGLFLLMRKLFSLKTAFISSVFYILSPFLFFYDRLAVPDGLLTTVFVYSALLFVYLVERLGLDMSLLLGGTLGIGLLTKSTAALSLFAAPFSLALFKWRKGRNRKELLKFALLSSLSILIALLIYNILRLSPLFYLINQRTPDFIFGPKEILRHPFDPFLGRIIEVGKWLIGYLTFPVFALLIAGVYLMVKKSRNSAIFLLAWFLIPLLIEMQIAKGFTPRYFIFITPFALAFSAYFVSQVLNFKKWVYALALGVLLIPAVLFEFALLTNPESAPIPQKEKEGYLEAWSAGYGIIEISNYLREQSKTGQPITVMTEGTQGYGTLPDGLQIYLRDQKNISISGVNWATVIKVPANLISDAKTQSAYLVVNESRLLDRKNPHLKLLLSFPKANGGDPLSLYKIVN